MNAASAAAKNCTLLQAPAQHQRIVPCSLPFHRSQGAQALIHDHMLWQTILPVRRAPRYFASIAPRMAMRDKGFRSTGCCQVISLQTLLYHGMLVMLLNMLPAAVQHELVLNCQVTTVDQTTGETGKEPLRTLKGFRGSETLQWTREKDWKGQGFFGWK